jgi:cell division protein FtsL
MVMNLKQKFNQLSKAEKILAYFVFVVTIGGLLFFMGYEVGVAIYKALQ